MSYTEKQMEYIDSVEGQAHQSAVDIIGQLQSDLAAAKAEIERLKRCSVLTTIDSTNQQIQEYSVRLAAAEKERNEAKATWIRYKNAMYDVCRIIESGFRNTLFPDGQVILEGDEHRYVEAIVKVARSRCDEVKQALSGEPKKGSKQ